MATIYFRTKLFSGGFALGASDIYLNAPSTFVNKDGTLINQQFTYYVDGTNLNIGTIFGNDSLTTNSPFQAIMRYKIN